MSKKVLKRTIIAVGLICMLAVGTISAFFTDTEETKNVFTVGKVDITMEQPSWVEPTSILPEQEIAKDPQLTNVGVNDAYVFMTVEVPYANVVTATDNGTKNTQEDTELFTYDVKDEWVEIGTGTKNENTKTVTHLYAYGTTTTMKALVKNASTETLFDYVKFANVIDGQGLEGGIQNVIVKAYAIQTTNINDGKTVLDGNNNDGQIAPDKVWEVLAK